MSITLYPGAFELEVAEHIGIIPQCPFCGRWPLIVIKYNPETDIYGAEIICDATYCGASMQSNAKSKEAARRQVIENWKKRYQGKDEMDARDKERDAIIDFLYDQQSFLEEDGSGYCDSVISYCRGFLEGCISDIKNGKHRGRNEF
jgi:hypothetical protein